MTHIVTLCIVSTIVYVVAASDDYVFYFKRADFFHSDILQQTLPQVDRTVDSLCVRMETNCRFTQAIEECEALHRAAPQCLTTQDRKMIKEAKSGFVNSREKCVKEANCKKEVTKAVEEAAISIKKIDTDKLKEIATCDKDDQCKYTVYNNAHNDIFNLYLTTRPKLRLLADQDVASSDCAGAVVSCMVASNAEALRRLYQISAQLKQCQQKYKISQSGILGANSGYMHAPEFFGYQS
ncbi:uncharacterized protein LOC129003025 [Macrosteles quadrilineatus]|uniref:uncharacterized protein LOC129003025 n=1 Tax=Macrosteles quadrilineatus TaxID=74068 RepID=UPI0023E3307A|nr:uncharacterized protein LOC129003025 [Macrosteles quadrilineatus]